MVRTIINNFAEILDTLLGYMAAFLAFFVQCNWMSIGAAILLVSRLIVDVPKAWHVIKRIHNGARNG